MIPLVGQTIGLWHCLSEFFSLDPVPRSSPPAKLKSKLKDITLEGSRVLYDVTPTNGQAESKPKSKRRRVVESEPEGDEPPGTDLRW